VERVLITLPQAQRISASSYFGCMSARITKGAKATSRAGFDKRKIGESFVCPVHAVRGRPRLAAIQFIPGASGRAASPGAAARGFLVDLSSFDAPRACSNRCARGRAHSGAFLCGVWPSPATATLAVASARGMVTHGELSHAAAPRGLRLKYGAGGRAPTLFFPLLRYDPWDNVKHVRPEKSAVRGAGLSPPGWEAAAWRQGESPGAGRGC
jgi:hypothetical protein